MNFREIATSYVTQNISVIPLQYKSKDPYFDLLPRDDNGDPTTSPFFDRLPTLQEIEDWSLRSHNRANIGIVTGVISQRFALDIDPRHGGHRTWEELSGGRGLDTLIVKSGGGGQHIYYEHPGFPFRFKATLEGIDVKADRAYCVAPPSIHESGSAYECMNDVPLSPIPEFLRELIVPREEFIGDVIGDWGIVDVSEALRVFKLCEFKRAQEPGRYATKSEYDYAVIVTLVNKGCDFDTLCAAFEGATQHATHYQTIKNPRTAQKYLWGCYQRAMAQGDSKTFLAQREKVREVAATVAGYVGSHYWKDVAGKTDRAVMRAHIAKMEMANYRDVQGRYVWDLSVREISELAKVKLQTASEANHRLIEAGWLLVAAKPSYSSGLSTRYRLGEKCAPGGHVQTAGIDMFGRVPFMHSLKLHNQETYGVFERYRGFGQTGEDIWKCLHQGHRTLPSLIECANAHRTTVMRQLKKMELYSMVVCIDSIYTPTPNYDFKKLARELGTEKIASVRKARYEIDREVLRHLNEQRRRS